MSQEPTARPKGSRADSTNPVQPTRLVWHPFMEAYVSQAPARMQRREQRDECPFCADVSSGRVPADARAWLRPNDFPALRPPVGECLILVYSRDHDRPFAALDVDEVEQVIALWQEVYRRLAPTYRAVMTWETSGRVIGQTQPHPHGQTYGVSVLPDLLARELAVVERAEAEGQPCPFCAELAREDGGPRAVVSGAHWVGYVPPYARYPYEVHLAPRMHIPTIADLTAAEAARELATHLLALVRGLGVLYAAPMPYMLALHQLGDPRFHLHLELLPVGGVPGTLKQPASAELAFGFWLNDALPDDAAAQLRAAVARTRGEMPARDGE